jgi:Resolvase, N terminal domain
MSVPMRPAAYIRIDSRPGAPSALRQREAIIEVARQRGWSEPAVYADEGLALADEDSPGLAVLSGAVGAGRHDAVIMSGPGVISRNPARLMAFLFRCTDSGVAVEFVGPSAASNFLMQPPPAARLSPALSLPAAARYARLCQLPRAAPTADILTLAGVEALSGSFPDWRIWADEHGWHARRRGNMCIQAYQRGAPAFCVHAASAVDLAAQLRWQQAADLHAPAGCPRE